MKFKISNIEKGEMILTGSKILKTMMDNTTPPIDLFVREVIQNSADAILPKKEFGIINFNTGKFNRDALCETLSEISEPIKKICNDYEYDFISISDKNTCGLLGGYPKNEDGTPNNLYNLVYDFMNDKEDSVGVAGGSYGVGKSVYFKYGRGMCFYYSRTYENGVYKNKLAGTLIQDERDEDCFTGKNSSGIAYFVDSGKIPIYDENSIKEFLNIFGLKPYSNNETGTVVIIPFIDLDVLLSKNNNSDFDIQRYWLKSIEKCLEMSIQRWYFPRINNRLFNGKYLKISVNGQTLELCDFFQELQDLYNGKTKDCTKVNITHKAFSENNILGSFNYKIFSKYELKIHNPPHNYPYPKFFVDSNIEVDKNGLLFYTRKPGMINNYENTLFGEYKVAENTFLIGVFKLNDELIVKNEKLGEYIRKTEKSNHYTWDNAALKGFDFFSDKKPFKKICSSIKKLLNKIYEKNTPTTYENTSLLFQQDIGRLTLPPEGYGTYATLKDKNTNKKSLKTKNNYKITNELNEKGFLEFKVNFILESHMKIELNFYIKAGAKKYSFTEWEDLGFDLPCLMKKLDISNFKLNNAYNENIPEAVPIDENFKKCRIKRIEDQEIVYKFQGLATNKQIPCGFTFKNVSDKQLKAELNLEIQPNDHKYSVGCNVSIKKEEENA